MKIKKFLFTMMVFVLTLALLGACTPAAPEVVEIEKEVVVTQIVEVEGETVIQEVVVTAEPETEVMAEPEPLRIAQIHSSTVNDIGFASSMNESLLALQEEMGEENLEIALSENTGPDALAAARHCARGRLRGAEGAADVQRAVSERGGLPGDRRGVQRHRPARARHPGRP